LVREILTPETGRTWRQLNYDKYRSLSDWKPYRHRPFNTAFFPF